MKAYGVSKMYSLEPLYNKRPLKKVYTWFISWWYCYTVCHIVLNEVAVSCSVGNDQRKFCCSSISVLRSSQKGGS